MSDLNIYQRINAVMGEIDYIKRGSAGQGTGVLYDEVIADLQPLLIKHGIVVKVDFLADSSRANAKGNYIYEGYFDVHYINMDKPDDAFTSKIVAHAMDAGDKAPGKAITYASKIAHLKTFGYETGEMDEGRNFDKGAYTDEIKDQFDDLLAGGDDMAFYCFYQFVGPDVYTSLYNSFGEGKKQAGKKKCNEMTEKGLDSFNNTVHEIGDLCDKRDVAVLEITAELSDMEKRFVAKGLHKHQLDYLKKIAE